MTHLLNLDSLKRITNYTNGMGIDNDALQAIQEMLSQIFVNLWNGIINSEGLIQKYFEYAGDDEIYKKLKSEFSLPDSAEQFNKLLNLEVELKLKEVGESLYQSRCRKITGNCNKSKKAKKANVTVKEVVDNYPNIQFSTK